jgi:hypothetical protein
MARRISLIVAALICLGTGLASAQERFGGLTGTVTDATKGALPGTTVTATNLASGSQRVVVTTADGSYRVPDLEPGRYSVSFELDTFQKFVMNDVLVLLGRTVGVDAELRVGGVAETVNVTADAAKQLDMTKVTLSHNITAEEFDRLPKARSFQGLALTAPGVNTGEIEGGLQVNGASAAENSFTVDGVAINSLIYGNSRQNTVFEYIQEVQVKTGGVDAEFGGALGGVVSAVTKSGGNTFSGETHYYYSGSALSASPFKRLVLNPNDLTTVGYFQDDNQANHQSEFGGSLGGPIVRNKLFFFGSVSPRVVRRTNEYMFSAGTEPGEINQKQTAWQGFGKVTYAANKVHANASLLMTPTRSTGRLPGYDSLGTNWLTTSKAANLAETTRGFDADQNNFSSNVDIWLRNNSVGRCPGQPAGRHRHVQHAAHPDHQLRHHEAGLRAARLQPCVQRGRLAPAERRLGRAPLVQRRGRLLSGRLCLSVLGSGVPQQRHRADRHRHLRVLRGARPRHARQRRREHAQPVHPGHVDGGLAADAEHRRAHREREDPHLQS